ncbi:Uncharacterized protein FKW44_023215, partial [Caligus rogercresseyi]
LGCFQGMHLIGTDEFPYSPAEINLQLKLYTRTSAETPDVFKYTEAYKLSETSFNSTKPTKFIVHGFGGSCDKQWVGSMKGAKHPRYAKAASTTQIVGKMVAVFIKDVITRYGDIKDRLHLIGLVWEHKSVSFSLNQMTFPKITFCSHKLGLDPAGPIFGNVVASKRLDKTDANFVDVIHTNGDTLLKGVLDILNHQAMLIFILMAVKIRSVVAILFYTNLKNVVNS